MSTNAFNFKDTLVDALNDKGISQRELCRRVNLTPNGLQGAFKANDIRISMLIKICNELNMDIQSFFDPEYISDDDRPSLKHENDLLKRLLESKDETIQQLKLRIQEMKESN